MPGEKDISIKNKDILSFKNIKSLNTKAKFLFCYKKTSRILKALYILTDTNNLFSNGIKDNLRLAGHSIVRRVIDLFIHWSKPKKNELEGDILYALSLIDAAGASGVITEENAFILGEEYEKVLSIIDNTSGSESYGFESGDSLDIEKMVDTGLLPEDTKVLAKRTNVAIAAKSLQRTTQAPKTASRVYKGQKESFIYRTKQSEREKIINDEIKRKGVVTVKDISVIMPSVSEKTVQRELIGMVVRGVLKKEGERRWSKYSLA